MQGKNVAHAAIADDRFFLHPICPNPPMKRLDWGEAVINKCRLEVLLDEDETRPPNVSSFSHLHFRPF